jgi:hypothetical protein
MRRRRSTVALFALYFMLLIVARTRGDWASFTYHDFFGVTSATVNGGQITIPPDFLLHFPTPTPNGEDWLVHGSVYSEEGSGNPSPIWVATSVPTRCDLTCEVGIFGIIYHPGGEAEPVDIPFTLGDYPMHRLLGQPVFITELSPILHRIDIGTPGTVYSPFPFLDAWFRGSMAADFNNDGSVTLQDLLSFLTVLLS